MDKEFTDWIHLKENLHEKIVGKNIGREINGKSRDFTRPVIIYKKLAHGFYFVIPATTKLKNGTWYIGYRHKSTDAAACLHQARAIDHRRFHSKMGELDGGNFQRIKAGFATLYT